MEKVNNKELVEIEEKLKNEFVNKEKEEIVIILKNKEGLIFKRVKNISNNKVIHLEGEHKEYFDILKNTQFLNNKPKHLLIGIAHNHPIGSGSPSKTDLDNWFYDIHYFIYSNKLNELSIYDKNGNCRK